MTTDYILGISLGQAAEFSALCVLESQKADEPDALREFALRGLKRWPPGSSYPGIIEEVRTMLVKMQLTTPTLVLDCTVLNRPIKDLFRRAALPVTLHPVSITLGHDESKSMGWHQVAKTILVASVLVPLQERRLQFAERMPDAPVLVKELQNYRLKPRKVNENELLDPREGEHDDMVLALGLCCWWPERPQIPFRFW